MAEPLSDYLFEVEGWTTRGERYQVNPTARTNLPLAWGVTLTNADTEILHDAAGFEGTLGRSEAFEVVPRFGGEKKTPELKSVPAQFDPTLSYGQTRAAVDSEFERRYVSWLLERQHGNLSAAAREARMDRKHLHDLAKKHGLRSSKTTARF